MTDLPSAARALVTGTLPADHDKLTEAIDVLSRAAHTPAIHTCHAECPCHTGGKPLGDFVGDVCACLRPDPEHCEVCAWWDDHYREALGVER